jgi:hypothetical protein
MKAGNEGEKISSSLYGSYHTSGVSEIHPSMLPYEF